MIKYIIFNPGTLNIIVTAINCLMEKRKVVIKYKVCKVEIKVFFQKCQIYKNKLNMSKRKNVK